MSYAPRMEKGHGERPWREAMEMVGRWPDDGDAGSRRRTQRKGQQGSVQEDYDGT